MSEKRLNRKTQIIAKILFLWKCFWGNVDFSLDYPDWKSSTEGKGRKTSVKVRGWLKTQVLRKNVPKKRFFWTKRIKFLTTSSQKFRETDEIVFPMCESDVEKIINFLSRFFELTRRLQFQQFSWKYSNNFPKINPFKSEQHQGEDFLR